MRTKEQNNIDYIDDVVIESAIKEAKQEAKRKHFLSLLKKGFLKLSDDGETVTMNVDRLPKMTRSKVVQMKQERMKLIQTLKLIEDIEIPQKYAATIRKKNTTTKQLHQSHINNILKDMGMYDK